MTTTPDQPPAGDPSPVVTSEEASELPPPPASKAEDQTSAILFQLEVDDARWRLDARKLYGKILVGLLIAQNLIVFGLLTVAGVYGELAKIVPIVVTVTSATLVETAAVVQIIVRWLFKDITYPRRKDDPN